MTHEEMERKKRAILQSLAEGARAESAAPNEDDEEDGDIFVSTVTEAIALLLMHKEPGGARYRRRLIRFITDPKHQVYDSPNIYHNFVMHLFKLRDYIAALEVCDFVLRFAPQSRDILGDAIRACGESCQFERGERYLARAMEIPKELWCWRLFCYSVDFLKEKMIAYPADMAVAERAIALADEFSSASRMTSTATTSARKLTSVSTDATRRLHTSSMPFWRCTPMSATAARRCWRRSAA